MSRRSTLLLALAVLSPWAATPALASESRWQSPELDALIHEGLRHNSDGDFEAADEVWQRLAALAPHHPAANVHAVETLFWLQIYEDDDRSLDEPILEQSEVGIRKAREWVEEQPEDARARLYLGQGLMNLGRLHGIRLRIYKAGKFGEQARKELERALELDPTLTDAKYPIGLYAYYASLVPDLVQWLSFLWFVPTANAPLGLQYLAEVRRHGDLYQFTATFYLANIRSYHDKWLDLPFALSTLQELHAAHPRNSLVHFELLEALMLAERYEEMLSEAIVLAQHPGSGDHDRGRANMARVWRARAELYLGHPDTAAQLLETFGEDGPKVPSWANRWVHLTRAQIQDAQGDRARALVEYEKVTSLELNPKFSRSTELAAEGVESPFRPRPQISARRESSRGGDLATP